jgi:LPS-assembly protein
MYHKKNLSIMLSLAVVSSLWAQEQSNAKVEILAKELESTKTTVSTKEQVVVYYNDSVIKANRANFDRKNNILTLDGDIEMIGAQGAKQYSQHMTIHTESDQVSFKKLFLMSESDVWLLSESAKKKKEKYTLGESVVSSCEVNDPLWKIHFNRSDYDDEEKYMKLYNATMYFLDVPVLYTPYLSFSTDNKRKSGLLFPLFGYNENEGFVYDQPIFWNISPSRDMQFNPQIRTDRSIGLYTTYRFATTPYSSGQIRVGYFRDQKSYQLAQGNENQSHYGFEYRYDASQFFSDRFSEDVKDGLYANLIWLNDIDYINLQKSKISEFGLHPLQESRLNYFIHDDSYYGGINAKYFIDTRLDNDDETLQVLPSIQLHKYLSHLIWNNLTYSVDFHFNNFYRKQGATLQQAELKIPFEFTIPLLDDYLNFSFKEELYYSKFFFGNGSYTYDSFEYYSNIHQAQFFSDLTKEYDSFVHVMHPSITYTIPGNEIDRPVEYSTLIAMQPEVEDLFTVGLPDEHFTVSLGHYFYDKNMNLIFFQRLSKSYYDEEYNKIYEDLNNEMQYNWESWQFYNEMRYSFEYSKVRQSSSRVSKHEDRYDFMFTHTYKQKLPDDTSSFIPANDISFDFNYDIDEHYAVSGGLTYNLDESTRNQWRVGGRYTQDCWSVDLSLRKDITPRPTGYTKQAGFFVQFEFSPFASLGSRPRR